MKTKFILFIVFINFFQVSYSQVDSIASPQEFKVVDYKKYTSIPKSTNSMFSEQIPNALNIVFDRLYIENMGIEAFRENLSELLGRIIIKENGGNEIGFLSIKKDSAKIQSFVPTQNKLISHKLTKNSSAAISIFINASATDEKIYEYLVTDISRAILEAKNVDKELLKRATTIAEKDELTKYYIITGVTVTEISKREFAKKERRINATNFPLSGIAISFDGNFYVSDDSFEREYKIGFTISSLSKIKREVDALLK